MLGMTEGNGHPYSWSIIINGKYNAQALAKCPYAAIIDYLTEINIQIFISDIGNKDLPLDPKKATVFEIKNGVLRPL